MTSYDFEKAAKNAVISVLDKAIDISQLDIVWFSSSLGYMKCTILGDVMGDNYSVRTLNCAIALAFVACELDWVKDLGREEE